MLNNKFGVDEALRELGQDIINDMKSLVPRDMGDLEDSISFYVEDNILHITMLEYGQYVNDGTKPHMPPISAIEGWAKRKGISPWAVAYSIATYGTEPQNFMKKFEDFDREYFKNFENKIYEELESYIYETIEKIRK